MDRLGQIQRLVAKLSEDEDAWCFISFFGDGRGFVSKESETEKRDVFIEAP